MTTVGKLFGWLLLLLLLLLLLVWWLCCAPDEPDEPGPEPGPRCGLFTSNARNSDASVLRFDAGGTGTTILGLADGLGSPRGMGVDADSGDLLIADAAAQKIFRWSAGAGLSVVADAADGVGNPEDVEPDCGNGGTVTPGTIYGLVFDNSAAMETVVTVDPVSGAVTPVGPGVPDCCTIGGFPVSALDAAAGRFYAGGNLLSDPGSSARRLLGFDTAAGTLAASPPLPAGYNYNRFELAVAPLPRHNRIR